MIWSGVEPLLMMLTAVLLSQLEQSIIGCLTGTFSIADYEEIVKIHKHVLIPRLLIIRFTACVSL